MSRAEATIEPVGDEGQLQRILPLMRAYCDFYAVSPSDRSLLDMSRALMADPLREGRQLLATQDGEDVGFATVFWSWSTTIGARIGVMNDLFVREAARRDRKSTRLNSSH